MSTHLLKRKIKEFKQLKSQIETVIEEIKTLDGSFTVQEVKMEEAKTEIKEAIGLKRLAKHNYQLTIFEYDANNPTRVRFKNSIFVDGDKMRASFEFDKYCIENKIKGANID